jgi:hypothetical protein
MAVQHCEGRADARLKAPGERPALSHRTDGTATRYGRGTPISPDLADDRAGGHRRDGPARWWHHRQITISRSRRTNRAPLTGPGPIGSPTPRRFYRWESHAMAYLSDVDLRAILVVLVGRAGGSVEISNEELYDAMMPDSGQTERFVVTETAGGVRVSVHGSLREQAGSN